MARPRRKMSEEEKEERKKKRRRAILILLDKVQDVCKRSGQIEDLRERAASVVREINQFLANQELSGGIPHKHRLRLRSATERFDRLHQRREVDSFFRRNKQVADACKELQKALNAIDPPPIPIWQIAAAVVGIVAVVVIAVIVINGDGGGGDNETVVAGEVDDTASDDVVDDAGGTDDTGGGNGGDDEVEITPVVTEPPDDDGDTDATDDQDDTADDGDEPTPVVTQTPVVEPTMRRFFTLGGDGFESFDLVTSVDPDPFAEQGPVVNGSVPDDLSEITFTILQGVDLEGGEPLVSESAVDIIQASGVSNQPESYEIVDDYTLLMEFADTEQVRPFMREVGTIEVATIEDS